MYKVQIWEKHPPWTIELLQKNSWVGKFCLKIIYLDSQADHISISVFLNSGPHDPLPCMFSMFPSCTTPDSKDQLVIKLCSVLIRNHSFESGVVEEGNIQNMQGSGSWGPELRNTGWRPPGSGDKKASTTQIFVWVFLQKEIWHP